MIIFKEYTTFDDELAAKWRALWQASPYAHFFNSPEWYQTCISHEGPLNKIIIAAWRGSELVAIVPLIRARHFGITVLRSPGGKLLDRSTLLIAKDEITVVNPMIEYMSKIAPLYLAEVTEEIMRACGRPDNAYIVPTSLTIYGEVTNDPLHLMQRKNKKRFDRTLKKIKDDLSFEYVRADEPGRLDTIFAIENASYKIRDGRGLFTNYNNKKLFRHLVKEAGELCRVAFIFYKGRPIAHELGFQTHGTFMSYHTAYHQEFTSFMPGKALIFYLIQHLHRLGVHTIDFSRGENSLKRQFASQTAQQYDIYVVTSPLMRWYARTIIGLKKSILYGTLRNVYAYLYRYAMSAIFRVRR